MGSQLPRAETDFGAENITNNKKQRDIMTTPNDYLIDSILFPSIPDEEIQSYALTVVNLAIRMANNIQNDRAGFFSYIRENLPVDLETQAVMPKPLGDEE